MTPVSAGSRPRRRLYLDTSAYLCILLAEEGSERLSVESEGAELLSSALADGADLRSRFARHWELLLPAIITDKSLGYYREFLARQSARQQPPAP